MVVRLTARQGTFAMQARKVVVAEPGGKLLLFSLCHSQQPLNHDGFSTADLAVFDQ